MLGRTLPLQGERRDTDSRTAGVGAAAASREKTRQASVENRSACCLYSYVAMLPVTEGLLLAAIAAGGQAGQYGLVVRGKAFTADQIDALDNSEIEKLYARYEARLGAAMTKTLGSAALQLYAGIAAMFLPIEN